jgi:ribosomal protein S18 acetylase RimI-like enzyme
LSSDGSAVDQVTGDRYGHIFLITLIPSIVVQGIASARIHRAKDWAKSRGQTRIGLQVFINNDNALNLYQNLGFQTRSLLMWKNIYKLSGDSIQEIILFILPTPHTPHPTPHTPHPTPYTPHPTPHTPHPPPG